MKIPSIESTKAWRTHTEEIARIDAAIQSRETARNGLLAEIEATSSNAVALLESEPGTSGDDERIARLDGEIHTLREHRDRVKSMDRAVEVEATREIAPDLRDDLVKLQRRALEALINAGTLLDELDAAYSELERQGFATSAVAPRVVGPTGGLSVRDAREGHGAIWTMARDYEDAFGETIKLGRGSK